MLRVFVTHCGVALAAAHCSNLWVRKAGTRKYALATDFLDTTFELDVVVSKVGDLDVCVLRLPRRPINDTNFLPLPVVGSLNPTKVGGCPVSLVHGNISWTQRVAAVFGQSHGRIVAVSNTMIHYDIATMGGHSGAALLLKGSRVIGMHVEGVNDVDDRLSEMSPSTHGDAVRLDLAPIHAAVESMKRAALG